jgi:C1A family cysteine protease
VLLAAGAAALLPFVSASPAVAGGTPAAGAPQQLRAVSQASPYGYVRPPYVRPAGAAAKAKQLAAAPHGLNGLPASYDLRTLPARIGVVRNQNPYGTCWAFAALAALESGLMPAATYDFSEDNLALNSGFGFGDPYNHGGNDSMAAAYLTRWAGPVNEAADAYGDSFTPAELSAVRHLQEIRWIAPAAGADNQALKQAVVDTGAVSVSVYWSNTYYNAACAAYYMPPGTSSSSNHAVAVVGWDDAYPRDRFRTAPAGDGAWLVRNSWGPGWGAGGYFWASYYDGLIGTDPWAYVAAEPADNHDAVYQWDTLGLVDSYSLGGQTAWFANHFVAGGAERLTAVSFWALAPGTSYELWYGPGLARPVSGSMTRLATGSLTCAGYHTVNLTAPPSLPAGRQFVVAVKVTTPGTSYAIPIEMRWSGYSDLSTGEPGQSFISADGSSWTDFDTRGLEGNVCLKAFTRVDGAQSGDPQPTGDVTAPFTVDDTGDAWRNEDVQVVLEADDSDGSGVALTEYRVDGGAWIESDVPGWAEIAVAAPAGHGGDGVHAIAYRSTDNAGNVEAVRTCTVKIDTRRPVTAVLRGLHARRDRRATVRFRVSDGAPSCGVAKATVVVYGRVGTVVLRQRLSRRVHTNSVQTCRLSRRLAHGTYVVRVLATDAAGNAQAAVVSRRFVVR